MRPVDLNVLFTFTGFKLKDFLRDNETLSEFLEQNATLSKHAVQQIVEANVNLEKVRADFKGLIFIRFPVRFVHSRLRIKTHFMPLLVLIK